MPEVERTRTITIGEIMTVDFTGKIEAGGGGEQGNDADSSGGIGGVSGGGEVLGL